MRDDPAPEMRKCAACGAVKPLTEDHYWVCSRKRGRVYFLYTCKPCMRERRRKPKEPKLEATCKHCGISYPFTGQYFALKCGKVYPTCRGCDNARRRASKIKRGEYASARKPVPCERCNTEYPHNNTHFAVGPDGLTRVCKGCATGLRRCAQCGSEKPLTKQNYREQIKNGKKYYASVCRECQSAANRAQPMGYPICRAEWRRPVEPITFDWWLRNEAHA